MSLYDARQESITWVIKEFDVEAAKEKIREEACAKVRLRELSRARTHLTSSGLAPGTRATLPQLQNEQLRLPTLTEALPEDATSYVPA